MKKNSSLQNSQSQLEALEKQDARKTEFFLAASHQLKTPLAIIQWCLQSSMESPTLQGKDREWVDKALSQANAMSHLVSDMLNVFRLVNRQNKPQTYVALNLHELMEQIFSQYEVMAHQHGVHLVQGPMENIPPVFADQAYLKQAIINLVDNAIKYTPEGGKVTFSLKRSADNFAEIWVMDEGIGINEVDKNNLFTEFFRSEEAQKVAHDGTGLGLVLVKQIIEEFGGQVLVESQWHHGSNFIIRLPLPS